MADIGTDHAYLPVFLLENGIVPAAIATDRSEKSLGYARSTVAASAVNDKIEIRAGDGLTVLAPGEAGTIVLAGMGGILMGAILEKGSEVLQMTKRLVLQPQRDIDKLRLELVKNGWRIADEKIVKDSGIFYQVMAWEPGSMSLTPAEALYGPVLLRRRDPLLREYLEQKAQDISVLITELNACSGENAKERLIELNREKEELIGLLKTF